MFAPRHPRTLRLCRSISSLLPIVGAATLLSNAHAEVWSVTSTSNGTWSDVSNWTDAVPGNPAPPGIAGGVYTDVRLNINGSLTYTATEGTQTYDVSPAGGDNRAFSIATTSGQVGSLTMTGGELILIQEGVNTAAFIGNGSATASGTLNLNGGKLTINETDTNFDTTFTVGFGGGSTAVVNINSGGVLTTDFLKFSEGGSALGTLNLNSGGILETRTILENIAAGTSTLNFDGGTIRLRGAATGSNVLISAGVDTASIKAGGLTVNTNGFTGQINKPLSDGGGGGGLTKSGNGTLILLSDSTYTGATVVSQGTLQLGNNSTTGSINAAGTLTMAAGTTLALSRTDSFAQSTFTGAGAGFQTGLGGDVGFTKGASNIFTADVANSYTGATTITGGAVIATNAQALGTTAGASSVAAGSTLALSNVTVSGEAITINGDGGTVTGGDVVNSTRGALQGSLGSSVWTGNVTIGSTSARIGIQDGVNLTVSGTISDAGAGYTMIFRGGNASGGLLTLTGTGNQWGRTEVYGQTVRIGGNDILPTAAPLSVGITSAIITQSTFDLNGFNQKVAGLTQASSSTGVITNNGGTNSVLTIDSSTDQTYQGVLKNGATNTLALIKSGSFTQRLTGNSTYTGPTTVNAGILLVNGGLSGSTVTVNGGTLGGTGTITGPVTISSGASLLGGDGATASDDLAVNGNLSLTDGSVIKLTLGAAGAHSKLTRTGGTWSFDLDQAFSFIDAGAQSGLYDNVISGLASNPGTGAWTITNANFTGTFTYDGFGGVDLTLTVVPEPGSALMFLGGAAMLRFRRRRS